MKNTNRIWMVLGIALACLVASEASNAAEKAKKEKAKPYTLKTCAVSDEKLGEMGDPFVFVHEGQEIKLCCKSCMKDFKKDPAKYIKKVEKAEKKASKQ